MATAKNLQGREKATKRVTGWQVTADQDCTKAAQTAEEAKKAKKSTKRLA